MDIVIPVILIIFVTLLGMGLSKLTALSFSGWSAFLTVFPDRPEEPSSAWQSVSLAEFRAQYDTKNLEDRVQVSVAKSGMRIKLCERWCEPTEPIMVPWSRFRLQVFRWRGGIYEEAVCLRYQLRFAGPRGVTMLVSDELGREIQGHLMESQIEECLGKEAMRNLVIR